MTDEQRKILNAKYSNRNIMEELSWGTHGFKPGYLSRENAEFINWLCDTAYTALEKAREKTPTAHWIRWHIKYEQGICTIREAQCKCSVCGKRYNPQESQYINFCQNCGSAMTDPDEYLGVFETVIEEEK